MATRAKEPQLGRERRGVTSPSTQNPRKTPLSSKEPSLTKPSTSSSSSSGRNAARPTTASSSSSTNKQPSVKKVSSTDNLSSRQPNTLARRNSLDKQPARRNSLDKQPARRNSLDRPLPASSPKTRVSPAPKERTLRSSSTFTPRTTTTKPSSSDRLSKLPSGSKDHHPRMISTVRKSSTFNGRKQQDRTATTSKGTALRRAATPPSCEAVSSPLAAGIPLPETEEDLCASMTEADETLLNAGSSNEFADELDVAVDVSPKVEENESDEVVHEPKIVDEASIYPKPIDQDETVSDDTHIEKPADKLQEQETIACNDSQSEEHGETDAAAPAADHDEVEKVEDGQTSEASNNHDQTSEEEKEADHITEEHVVKQDDAEQTEAAATSAKPEVVQGQRDAAAVSNDVIEETASKLREQRKSRVRALAGAFETVISLQDK